MLRICKKFARAASAGEFFSLNEWNFSNDSQKKLVAAVEHAEDGGDFSCDIGADSGFEWDDYVKNYMLGIRQYVLKDDDNSLKTARAKLQK